MKLSSNPLDHGRPIQAGALLLEEAARSFAAGDLTGGHDLSRAMIRGAGRNGDVAGFEALLTAPGSAGHGPTIVLVLRALRKRRELMPGEARRLFRIMDRLGGTALIDRYVRWLRRRLVNARIPLRDAMLALWSTGRHAEVIEFVRTNHPARLQDVRIFRFFAERSIHLNDWAAALPLFEHVHALVPEDPHVRVALIRARADAGDFVGAARALMIETDAQEQIDYVAQAALAALGARPTAEAMTSIQEAAFILDSTGRASSGMLRAGRTAAAMQLPGNAGRATELDASQLHEAVDRLIALPARSAASQKARRLVLDLIGAADVSQLAPVLDLLLLAEPGLAKPVADRCSAIAEPAAGVAIFSNAADHHPSVVWQEALMLAVQAGDEAAADVFASLIARDAAAKLAEHRRAARSLAELGADGALNRFWSQAVATCADPRTTLVALRSLYPVAVAPAFWGIVTDLVSGHLKNRVDPSQLAEAMRVVLARAWRWNDGGQLAGAAVDPDLSPALATWIRAVIAWARFDREGALAELDKGVIEFQDQNLISFISERALLNTRFGHWGAAAQDLARLGAAEARLPIYARLAPVSALAAELPLDPGVLWPESLIDRLFDNVPTVRYEPEPNTLVTIAGALASGGGERQAVSVVTALTSDTRVSHQTLLVRRLSPEPLAFFLPQVLAAGIPVREFGREPTDLSTVLTLLGERPGSLLDIALRHLPEQTSTVVLQLVPILRQLRPAAVHIRQDFPAAALACKLAGVPRFLIHRGSLSPDLWDLQPPQEIATVRPMRHAYRRLLEHPGFGIVNNSGPGLETDRVWTGCRDSDRLHLVHNTVDFDALGVAGPSLECRRGLGIPDDAPVVGAAFRLHAVKRPLLWLSAARVALERVPNAHFLIVGDGELRQDLLAFAEAQGFSERLHLPGTVTNVGQWYRAMDLVLLTSEREGLPNMLIEAQHFGVPVVSTDAGGAAETMEPGVTGRLLPLDASAEVIGSAIADALVDRDWFQRASSAAPEMVHERFGGGLAVERLLELWGFAK